MRIGEKIFQLEKEELCSRTSKRSSYSKKTASTRVSKGSASSQVSLLKMKALTELAKREVEMKFARIESEKRLEMERKRHEMEEIQKMKSYETAKAEVDAVTRLEEEGKEENPNLDDLKEFQLKDDEKEERVRDYISSLSDLTSVDSLIPLPDSFVQGNRAQHRTSSSQKEKDTELSNADQIPQAPGKDQSNSASKQELATPPHLHVNSSATPYSTPPTIPYHPPTMESQQHGIAQAIAKGMEAAWLPTPHLSIFSGNPLDWPTWKVSFETVIEKRSMSSNEKILYLLQYLSGPPKKIVEGYQFLKTDDAYTEAKKSLEKRFGHPSVVAEAFRRKLENWPKIPPRDGISLREFADFLKTCELAMQSIEDLETLNKQHGNKQLLKILPNWVHPKWGVKVRDYQTKYGENKFPPFSAFVKFVTEIAEVQCLPVLTNLDSNFSVKEEKRRNFQRRTENRKSRDVNSLATQVKSPSDSMNGKKKAC